MTRSAPRISATLLIGSVLAINPVLLLLVGAPTWVIAALPTLCVLLLQLVWRRWQYRLPTVYAINIVALGGISLHAEVVVRIRYHDYVMEDLYLRHGNYYHNRPGLRTILRDKEYTVDYITNRDGYRIGASQDSERSVDSVDWLFLGDSYTQGAQVSFEELYTTLLYRRFPDRIILNAGVSGWGLPEARAFLSARGEELRPKVVFLQIANFNDFMNVVERRAGFSDYLMQESEFVRLLLQDMKYRNPTELPLGRWVEPFYPTEAENRRFNVLYGPTSPEKERDIESFVSVLGDIEALTREIGARLVLVQIPTKEQVSLRFLEEAVTGLGIDPRLIDLERPNRIVKHLADSLGLTVVDPIAEWRESSWFPFFEFDEHLNARGHEMLADAIAGQLSEIRMEGLPRILSTTYAGDRYPQFTPGGDSIVFQSPRNGNWEILQADIATWTESWLTIDDVSETHAVLLPGGLGMLFVVGDPDSGTTRVWRAQRDGRGAVPLTPSLRYGAIPAVFPGGERVVLPTWGPRPDDPPSLTVMHLNGGRMEKLPHTGDGVWRPAVAPNGQFIAYIARVDGQLDLFELDLSSGQTTRLTTTSWDEWDPAYTPDGGRIVFAAQAEGNWDLFAMRREGGALLQLTRTSGDEWDPQVSPDGATVAFGGEYGLMRGIYLLPLRR